MPKQQTPKSPFIFNNLQVNDRIGECTITSSMAEKSVEESPQIQIYRVISGGQASKVCSRQQLKATHKDFSMVLNNSQDSKNGSTCSKCGAPLCGEGIHSCAVPLPPPPKRSPSTPPPLPRSCKIIRLGPKASPVKEPACFTISDDEDEKLAGGSRHMLVPVEEVSTSDEMESPPRPLHKSNSVHKQQPPPRPPLPIHLWEETEEELRRRELEEEEMSLEDEEDEEENEEEEEEEENDDFGADSGEPDTLACRSVRIGTYKMNISKMKLIPVKIKHNCVVLFLPKVAQDPDDINSLFPLRLVRDGVVKVQVHFGSALPLIFITTTPQLAATINATLGMKMDGTDPNIDPKSNDETRKRITLLPKVLTDTHRQLLSGLFPASQLEELDQKRGNEILVRSTPQMNSKLRTITPDEIEEMMELIKQDSIVKPIVKLLTYPPPPQTGGITITSEDLECLKNGEFLNDVIIDFYLKYLFMEKLSEKDKARTHFFSTFFYTRLTQIPTGCNEENEKNGQVRRHGQVKTWTRHVDIFEKDFIVIPVLQMSHWFLAIVCYPGLVASYTPPPPPPVPAPPAVPPQQQDSPPPPQPSSTTTDTSQDDTPPVSEENGDDEPVKEPLESGNVSPPSESEDSNSELANPRPCILLLDSFAGPSRWKIAATLREYLAVEWKVRKGTDLSFDRNSMRAFAPKVPQQNNYYDCGVFVLQYVESFFEDPPVTGHTATLQRLESWFPLERVVKKRDELRDLILGLQRKYTQQQQDSS